MIDSEKAPHHAVGTFCHRIEQNTQGFFSGNFFICAVVTFPKTASAFFATIPLFSCYHAIFNRSIRTAFLAL
jgi:hypothetical protein